jgi:integrase
LTLSPLLSDNSTLTKFIDGVSITSKKTGFEYRHRLEPFRLFVLKKYDMSLDELILTLTTYGHGPKIDIYDLLSEYVKYLGRERKISSLTLKLMMSTVRSYLETFDVEILPRKYRLKVRTPKVIKQEKEALSRHDIQTILNACHNLKLFSSSLLGSLNNAHLWNSKVNSLS